MLPPGKPLKVCSSEPALRPPEQPRVCRPRAPNPRRLGEGLSTAVARGPPWLGSATSRRALPRRGLNGGAASTCRKGDGHRHSPVGSQRGSVPSPRPPQESYRREPQSRTCSPAEATTCASASGESGREERTGALQAEAGGDGGDSDQAADPATNAGGDRRPWRLVGGSPLHQRGGPVRTDRDRARTLPPPTSPIFPCEEGVTTPFLLTSRWL